MKEAIKVLKKARIQLLEEMRANPKNERALRRQTLELETALSVLKAVGKMPLPDRLTATRLDAVEFGPFAEYRLLWDYETDKRSAWKEISLRLSPGDIVLFSEEQFSEAKARSSKNQR